MQSWWEEIDLIDMTLQKVEDYGKKDDCYDSESDESYKRRFEEAEDKLREHFMSQIADASQR